MIVIFLLLSFGACDFDTMVNNDDSADFIIMSKAIGTTNTGRPMVVLTVKNIGTSTGYNLSCDIQVMSGKTIIGSGWAYFGGGGDIEPGEMARNTAIFYGMDSVKEYRLDYTLSWLEH